MVGDTPENKANENARPKRVFTPTIPQRRTKAPEGTLIPSTFNDTKLSTPQNRNRPQRNVDGRGSRGPSSSVTASGPFAMGPTAISAARSSPCVAPPPTATSGVIIADSKIKDEKPVTSEDISWFELKAVLGNQEWAPQILEIHREDEIEDEKKEVEMKPVLPSTPALSLLEGSSSSLHLIQMPPILPDIDPSSLPTFKKEENDDVEPTEPTEKGATEACEKLVEGQIGELIFRKSGRLQIKMGNLLFDVGQLPNASFLQEAVAIDFTALQAFNLGSIASQLLCTPNLDELVSLREREIAAIAEETNSKLAA